MRMINRNTLIHFILKLLLTWTIYNSVLFGELAYGMIYGDRKQFLNTFIDFFFLRWEWNLKLDTSPTVYERGYSISLFDINTWINNTQISMDPLNMFIYSVYICVIVFLVLAVRHWLNRQTISSAFILALAGSVVNPAVTTFFTLSRRGWQVGCLSIFVFYGLLYIYNKLRKKYLKS